MESGRPSATAEGAAFLRVAHQLLDAPRILDDPVVLRLVGPADVDAVRAAPARFEEPFLRGLRAAIAIRSRYAEDALADAVARGVRQYVVLGAGLDSFAYRNPFPTDRLRVFEVDHPATQGAKRERLRAAGIAIPPSLAFVPIDFERDALPAAMAAGGFDATAPAFVSWLGVAAYLERAAVLATLAWVASLPAGSEIVLTYRTGAPPESPAAAAMADHVAAVGEPWRSTFEPAELAAELRRLGFDRVEDFGPEAAFERYCRDRADGLRPGSLARLMRAARSVA